MKLLLALLCSLVIGTSGLAQSGAAKPDSAESETANAVDGSNVKQAPVRITPPAKTAPLAEQKNAGKAKEAEPAKKEEPKIKGVVVPRGEQGFLGVEIVGGAFKITFYDTKKKPKEPDVARAALRWDAKYKVGQERIVLNPDSDGKSLSNPRTIRPPYTFKLFITLIREATDTAEPVGETHVIDFKA